jgi:hypothetical protein
MRFIRLSSKRWRAHRAGAVKPQTARAGKTACRFDEMIELWRF